MKVLVAGASGFIGHHTVAALHEAGHQVVAVSRTRGALPDGVAHVPADVGAGPLDPQAFEGIDAIANLVGIAIERGANTFEAAHVQAVDHLLGLADALEVERFVHVSVVRPGSSEGGYHRTKLEGESRVTRSDRRWTILRPGLVYGPGDAMLSNLVRFVTLAPVFVSPAGPTGPLQTVDVADVADAVVRTLARPETEGTTLDVVGPDRYTLPQLVGAVADALTLPTAVMPLPAGLMRTAAAVMQRLLPHPPITPTQLGMLIDGLYGEHGHTQDHLGFTPRPLDAARIREVAGSVTAPSVRLLRSAEARTEATAWSVPLVFPLLAVASLLVGPWLIEDLWLRMLALEGGLLALLLVFAAPVRGWLRPRALGLSLGVTAVMVGAGLATVAALHMLAPGFAQAAEEVYGWARSWPAAATLLMLPVIAAAEDLVWRFGITLGLARRFGPGPAVLLGAVGFALAHATTGPPILAVAALLAGLVWGALAMRTRSLPAVLLCHVVWDASMVMLAP